MLGGPATVLVADYELIGGAPGQGGGAVVPHCGQQPSARRKCAFWTCSQPLRRALSSSGLAQARLCGRRPRHYRAVTVMWASIASAAPAGRKMVSRSCNSGSVCPELWAASTSVWQRRDPGKSSRRSLLWKRGLGTVSSSRALDNQASTASAFLRARLGAVVVSAAAGASSAADSVAALRPRAPRPSFLAISERAAL